MTMYSQHNTIFSFSGMIQRKSRQPLITEKREATKNPNNNNKNNNDEEKKVTATAIAVTTTYQTNIHN